MRARRSDDGFTLATTMVILALTLAFVGVAVTMALAGLANSQTSRSVERAQAAADAGADVAGYRMNKTLLAPASTSLLGLTGSVLQTVGCTGLGLGFGNSTNVTADTSNQAAPASATITAANTFTLAGTTAGNNFCFTTQSETLDDGETFRYAISTKLMPTQALTAALTASLTSQGVSVSAAATQLGQLIVRQVASIGQAGGVTRRVIVSYWLNTPSALVGSGLSGLTKLFVKRRYVRCPSMSVSAFTSDPFANCPANPGY